MSKKLAVLTLLAPILIFSLGFWNNKLRNDTIQQNNLIKVVLTDVDCPGVNHRSVLRFKYNGEIRSVLTAQSRCGNYNVGDEIEVYYNPEGDDFLLKDDGLANDNKTAMICAVILFGFMSYWVYGVFKQKK